MTHTQRAEKMFDQGWSGNDPELAGWLDKMGPAGDWFGMLKEAADMSPGMVEDMRNLTYRSRMPVTDNSTEITAFLAARRTATQATGDEEAFVGNFASVEFIAGNASAQADP